tara:strand:- start:205 stop:318 length:114 start_codon:yes stop_codon:yes gene_type:complete
MVGIDALQAASHHQALQYAQLFSAKFRPAEQIVFSLM